MYVFILQKLKIENFLPREEFNERLRWKHGSKTNVSITSLLCFCLITLLELTEVSLNRFVRRCLLVYLFTG